MVMANLFRFAATAPWTLVAARSSLLPPVRPLLIHRGGAQLGGAAQNSTVSPEATSGRQAVLPRVRLLAD